MRGERNGNGTTAVVDGPRQPARRRRLPTGRAVVGGLLVALAALGAFVAARGDSGGPSGSYVVMTHDVVAGTKLQANDLRTLSMDLPDGLSQRAFTDVDAVVGRLTTTPLSGGELIQASAVLGGDAADPRYQLSVPVERSRALDGMVARGEKVDVLVTYGSGTDGGTFVVARRAEVLRVDQNEHGALGTGSEMIVVLAVDTADNALAVTHAAQAGKVTLVRATGVGADVGPDSYQPPAGKGS